MTEVLKLCGLKLNEYKSLIESCGLIRFNNIGVIYAKGDDVLDLIDRLSTNDVSKLEDNFWMDTVLTTNKGRIVSQIRLLKSSKQILIVSDISVVSKIIEWIDFYTFAEDVEFKNITENVSIYSLIGPSSRLVIKKMISSSMKPVSVNNRPILPHQSITETRYGRSIPVDMDGKNLILNFDQIGVIPKVDLILDKNLDEPLMNFIWQQNINEVTPNIYNVFRIENRLPMHGSELVDNYNPLEANLLDNISFNKGCYVGQEVIARLNAYDKVRMQLVFLYLDKNCAPAIDMPIISGSNQVGVLTSFEFSDYADKWVALAYIKRSQCVPGNEYYAVGEGVKVKCEIGDFGLTD